MANIPPVGKNKYMKTHWGFFGELGKGANAQVKFIQTAISKNELDDIELIQNIPGSEKWEVRDLFQRDVDQKRVTDQILPYLQDPSQVKFFNPLTLVILPFDSSGRCIEKDLVPAVVQQEEENGHIYEVFEREPFFEFRVHKEFPAFSHVRWNKERVRAVAIDGQHRLSALKRWAKTPLPKNDFLDQWKIPVVILGLFRVDVKEETATVLEIVRKTFVYINSKAERICSAREILLTDENVSCLCTQELLQSIHENDVLSIAERVDDRIPLIFFDWRGEMKLNERVPAPAAVKEIEEVKEWFANYLLGSDNDDDGISQQQRRLCLDDIIPPLKTHGLGYTLSWDDAKNIREQFRKTMLPALRYLLEEFSPYKEYIKECRKKERASIEESDLAQHAFMQLRFGSHNAPEYLTKSVSDEYEELVDDFEELKHRSFDKLLSLDIGMRGIIAAFARGKDWFDYFKEETTDWLSFAKWFTPLVSSVYEEQWFQEYDELSKEKRSLLTHIAWDHAGNIVNYRFEQANQALGTFLLLLCFSKDSKGKQWLDEIWGEDSHLMDPFLKGGFRKELKANLIATFAGTQKQLKDEVNKKADKEVDNRKRKLRTYLKLE